MKEVIIDTLIDTLSIVPFLLVVFIILEYLEHHYSSKNESVLKNTKFGPIIGSILGIIPQCGFSVAATNLFSARAISIGTLISIYLSTSDEMLPILISNKASYKLILLIVLIKFIVGLIMGILIDLIIKKKDDINIKHMCEEDNCGCEENNVIKSAIKHTINITMFILVVTLILNIMFNYIGEASVSKMFMKHSLFSPFITSLIGLIPNCGASVIITELYLKKTILFGTMLAGLLTNSGIALVILFKENKNIKENILVLLMTYFTGSLIGLIINLFL